MGSYLRGHLSDRQHTYPNKEARRSLIRLAHSVMAMQAGLIEGCRKIWQLADQHGFVSLPEIEWFVQMELDFDKLVAGTTIADLSVRQQQFESENRNEIFARLGMLLFALNDPAYSLHQTAASFLRGESDMETTVSLMYQDVMALRLEAEAPYDEIYCLARAIDELPTGLEGLALPPEVIRKDEARRRELDAKRSERLRKACNVIVARSPSSLAGAE